MRQTGWLEFPTLDILTTRLGRSWGPHKAERLVWLGSWWLLADIGLSQPRPVTDRAAGG
jgi:hypothetical protein